MAQAQLLPPPVMAPVPISKPASRTTFRFRSLEDPTAGSVAGRRGATWTVSVVVHTVLLAAVIIAPLLYQDVLPAPSEAVRAFFVTPTQVAPPPPPPPPPPAAGAPVVPKAPVAAPLDPSKFTAPVEMPQELPQEEMLSFGVEGGVAGGVEGGVPGGVVGGIVGGLPTDAPAPAKVVRVGGQLRAPKVVHRVPPEYPPLAQAARLQALIILEAHVDTSGRVQSVTVLRGQPLFDEAAVSAVKQWRYVPLLLNGEPTEFILTVTVNFNLKTVQAE